MFESYLFKLMIISVLMHEALDREFGSRFLQFCKRDLYATSMQMYRFILFGVSQHF
jgi:low temperature requirement protein LtrA